MEWGVLAEPICDLTNTLLNIDSWDPNTLFMPYQTQIPPKKLLDDSILFGKAKDLAVEIPIDPRGHADLYIDDLFALSVDVPNSNNAKSSEAASLLAIHATAWPSHEHEPIPQQEML